MEDNKRRRVEHDSSTLTEGQLRTVIELMKKAEMQEFIVQACLQHPGVVEILKEQLNRVDVNRRVFVRGVPPDLTDDDLRRLFAQYGTLEDCQIAKDKQTDQSKGFAFVRYAHIDGALAALREPSKIVDGRVMQCQLSGLGLYGAPGISADRAVRRVYVGSVPLDFPAERLLQIFSEFGEVEEGPIGYDNLTKKSRGYAIFTYKTVDGANKALEESERVIDGHKVAVRLAHVHYDSSGKSKGPHVQQVGGAKGKSVQYASNQQGILAPSPAAAAAAAAAATGGAAGVAGAAPGGSSAPFPMQQPFQYPYGAQPYAPAAPPVGGPPPPAAAAPAPGSYAAPYPPIQQPYGSPAGYPTPGGAPGSSYPSPSTLNPALPLPPYTPPAAGQYPHSAAPSSYGYNASAPQPYSYTSSAPQSYAAAQPGGSYSTPSAPPAAAAGAAVAGVGGGAGGGAGGAAAAAGSGPYPPHEGAPPPAVPAPPSDPSTPGGYYGQAGSAQNAPGQPFAYASAPQSANGYAPPGGAAGGPSAYAAPFAATHPAGSGYYSSAPQSQWPHQQQQQPGGYYPPQQYYAGGYPAQPGLPPQPPPGAAAGRGQDAGLQ